MGTGVVVAAGVVVVVCVSVSSSGVGVLVCCTGVVSTAVTAGVVPLVMDHEAVKPS